MDHFRIIGQTKNERSEVWLIGEKLANNQIILNLEVPPLPLRLSKKMYV